MVLKVLGIGGSLRVPSNSLSCLQIAIAEAQQAGAETEIVNIRELDLPFYQPDFKLEDYQHADQLQAFLAKVGAAQGLILAASTYHGTLAGAFKNTLDFFEYLPHHPNRYLTGKIVGIITVGSGTMASPNALTALLHFTKAMRGLAAPSSVAVTNAKKQFDSESRLLDERITEQLAELGREVVGLVR